MLLILCGPSGVGKSTVGDRVIELSPGARWVRSYVTRHIRHGELEDRSGRVSVADEAFDSLSSRGLFAWVNENYSNRYGTSSEDIAVATTPGTPLYILDLAPKDVNKAEHLHAAVGIVMVLPPDADTLRQRLVSSGRSDRLEEAVSSYRTAQTLIAGGWLERSSAHFSVVNADSRQSAKFIVHTVVPLIGA